MPPTLAETMEAFRVGFAHGREEALKHVDSAISMCQMAREDHPDPHLSVRLATLRQIRLAIATIQPDIASK